MFSSCPGATRYFVQLAEAERMRTLEANSTADILERVDLLEKQLVRLQATQNGTGAHLEQQAAEAK